MHLEKIIYKEKEDGPWKPGWYFGKYENSSQSVILDDNYSVVEGDLWDKRLAPGLSVILSLPETEDVKEAIDDLDAFGQFN